MRSGSVQVIANVLETNAGGKMSCSTPRDRQTVKHRTSCDLLPFNHDHAQMLGMQCVDRQQIDITVVGKHYAAMLASGQSGSWRRRRPEKRMSDKEAVLAFFGDFQNRLHQKLACSLKRKIAAIVTRQQNPLDAAGNCHAVGAFVAAINSREMASAVIVFL